MARQIERELHARRAFGEALVDAHLEIKGAIEMPQHDAGRDRYVAGVQSYDFAVAARSRIEYGAADEGSVAFVLSQGGAALGFPSAGFEREERAEIAFDFARCGGDGEDHVAMFCEPVALAAQFLELLRPQCIAQQVVGVPCGVKAGALVTLQDARFQSAARQLARERHHDRAVQRDVAQDQRVGAAVLCLLHQCLRGLVGLIAIEQWRGERAVRIGADQCRQGKAVSAPCGHDRQKTNQALAFTGCNLRGQRADIGAALRGCIDRQFPFRKKITVGLDSIIAQTAPAFGAHRIERYERSGGDASVHARAREIHFVPRSSFCCVGNLDHSPVPIPRFMRTLKRRAFFLASLI